MKPLQTVISDEPDCTILLVHHPDDPAVWIVRKYIRRLFWRSCVLSRWFVTREQAERFARELARECHAAA